MSRRVRALLLWVVVLVACRHRTTSHRAPDASVAVLAPTCDPVPTCAPETDDDTDLDAIPQWRRIQEIARRPAEEIDLAEVSALLSQASDPAVDIPRVMRQLDELTAQVRATLPRRCDAKCRVRALSQHMFHVWGFRAEDDPNGLYNDPDRDLIDSVLTTRIGYCEGLTLVFLSLGRRLDIPLRAVLSRQHIHVRYVGPGGPFDIDTTREGAPPALDPSPPHCTDAPSLYGRPLDARELVGQIVSVVGILDGLHNRRAWLDAAVRMAPDDPDLRNNRGVERERWLDLDGALDDYGAAVSLDPCVGFYRTNLASVLRRMGRLDEAQSALDALDADVAAQRVDDDPLYPSLARGDVALERGDDGLAERYYARAIESAREASIAREAMGFARLVQHNPDGAAMELLAALELDPRAETRLLLVEALAMKHDPNARFELDRAARDDAVPEEVTLWQAILAEQQGDLDRAHRLAQQCLDGAGARCARGLAVLGDVARRRGDATCAQAYYQRFLTCPSAPHDRYRRMLDGEVQSRLAALADTSREARVAHAAAVDAGAHP